MISQRFKKLLCGSALACCLFGGSSFGQTRTVFKLSGKHVVSISDVHKWTVTQELVDEKTGKSTINKNFAAWSGRDAGKKGRKLRLSLPKVRGKDTVYNIAVTSENIVRHQRIRVIDPNRISSFLFKTGHNPAVRTYIFVPKSLSPRTRLVLVMHGLGRNADDYIASWPEWAKKNDYIVVAPNFDNKNWRGSRMYNLGNILTRNGLKKQKQEWSFQVVENLFQTMRDGFGLKKDYFDMFGHSAGGQFVHRFAFFMPDSKMRVALAANSGWYTVPDLSLEYPYGLKNSRFSYSQKDLLKWSRRKLYILRGKEDTERTPNLRQTKEADAQGKNRFERAAYMFGRITKLNSKTRWRLIDVPKAGHDQRRMAPAAQRVLERTNKK